MIILIRRIVVSPVHKYHRSPKFSTSNLPMYNRHHPEDPFSSGYTSRQEIAVNDA